MSTEGAAPAYDERADYPAAVPVLPPRTRGIITLVEESCTVCMLCARECPDWCVHIDSHTETLPADEEHRRPRSVAVLDRFAIDFSLCLYCGICVEVCPFDALHWSPEYSYAEPGITELTHEKNRLDEHRPDRQFPINVPQDAQEAAEAPHWETPIGR